MKKTSIAFFCAMIALTSCNAPKPQNKTENNNEKLVKQYFEYFNQHDWTKMASMYADTSEFKDPSLGQGIVKQTRQQIIDKYAALNSVFPDIKDSVVRVYPSDDQHIIIEFISSGTAPDGSKFQLPICSIITIENGIITKDFTYYDNSEEPKSE